MRSKRSENGESEVLGEILLVALVAIVACSVGASAFSMAGTVTNSKSVGLTGEAKNYGVVFTVQGGMDLNSVTAIDRVGASPVSHCISGTPKVGDTCTVGTDSDGRTTMVAKFSDGSSQVIFDKNWGSLLAGGGASDFGTISWTFWQIDTGNYLFNVTVTPGTKWTEVDTVDLYVNNDFKGNFERNGVVSIDGYNLGDTPVTRIQDIVHLKNGANVTMTDQTFSYV